MKHREIKSLGSGHTAELGSKADSLAVESNHCTVMESGMCLPVWATFVSSHLQFYQRKSHTCPNVHINSLRVTMWRSTTRSYISLSLLKAVDTQFSIWYCQTFLSKGSECSFYQAWLGIWERSHACSHHMITLSSATRAAVSGLLFLLTIFITIGFHLL